MPGTPLYDFADGARFICSTAVEDEKDLTKVDFDLSKFSAFSTGFLGRIKDASLSSLNQLDPSLMICRR